MIINYEIKLVDNEEILYLYINDNYEFARINKGDKRKNFLSSVLDFINKNDIKFAGTTIAIVAGGLIIGNLFLQKSDDLNLKNSIMSIHINPQIVEQLVLDNNFLDKTSINNEIKLQEDDKSLKKEFIKQDNTKEVIKKQDNINKIENIIKEEKNDIKTNKESIENINEQKDLITVFRSNGNILNLELEEYLVNVVAAEMPAGFNVEALKAQSVIARTYAKKIITTGRILTDTTSTQVYKDYNELKSMWGNNYNKYLEKIKSAVQSTCGIVLKYDGELIDAVYHSTSNGMTEYSENVWSNSLPYLKSVESSYDKNVKSFERTTFFSYSKMTNLLGFDVNNSTVFNIVSRNSSRRVSEILVNDVSFSGIEFREKMSLRSADFEITKKDDGIEITTYGYGHGVGMSQYGANEMAKLGFSYEEILKHYYQGVTLSSLWISSFIAEPINNDAFFINVSISFVVIIIFFSDVSNIVGIPIKIMGVFKFL